MVFVFCFVLFCKKEKRKKKERKGKKKKEGKNKNDFSILRNKCNPGKYPLRI